MKQSFYTSGTFTGSAFFVRRRWHQDKMEAQAGGVNAVCKYISNQRAHHHAVSFQDEYRLLLKKNKIDYDEKYVWD